MSRYNPKETEPRWRKAWDEAQSFLTRTPAEAGDAPKAYVLEMFPYPSGRIHMGHVRNYTMGDVVARFKRAQGFNVLHPMGWDAFGMPAENAAMERGVNPKAWTYENIAAMREQLKMLGLSIDWSREFATCDPAYYGRQQQLFLELYKRGLAYRREATVNWDPVDHTVLANEQVIDGRGWRSGALVEKKKLTQWFFKITAYADALIEGLKTLEGRWPDKVRLMQENWIGKSYGAKVLWPIESAPDFLSGSDDSGRSHARDPIEVYTTRPDTLFGASFLALAADHPLTTAIADQRPDVAAFVAECAQRGTSEVETETAEKIGVDLGVRVRHPFDPSIILPVYAANFVLSTYGTGAIFGCPAHDQRDFDFATKYALPIRPVVEQLCRGEEPLPYVGPGQDRQLRLPERTRCGSRQARRHRKGRGGRARAKAPPSTACATGVSAASGTGVARSPWCIAPSMASCPRRAGRWTCPTTSPSTCPAIPLDRHPTWKHTTCPTCGKAALRETDTLDTFVDSPAGTSPASPTPPPSRPSTRRRRITGCRWTSTSAGWSTRCCTCSTRASLPAPWPTMGHAERGRTLRGPVHPGHGHARDLPGHVQ